MKLTGELVDLAVIGLGASAADFVSQKFLFPIANKFLPAAGMVGTLVHAATTYVAAIGIGKGVGIISKRFGPPLELGGKIMAVAQAISSVVPNWSLGSPLPIFASNTPGLLAAASAPMAAGYQASGGLTLPAGSPANGYPTSMPGGISAEDGDI